MNTLEKGWNDATSPAGLEQRELLKRLFMVAVPDTYASTARLTGEPDLAACWSNLLGRLGPTLAAVSAVAGVAERNLAAETARGGSHRDRARRHLIRMLVETFARMFGYPPEAAPGSGGFRWFSATIELAGRRADEQLGLPETATMASSRAHLDGLKAVQALARHIGPPEYKMATEGTAKLDHWLREALDGAGARPGATRTPSSPSAPRTRERKQKKGE